GLFCFLAILIGLGYAAEGQFDERVQTATYAAAQVKMLVAAVVLAAIVYAFYVSYRFEIFQRAFGRMRATRISLRDTASGTSVRGPGAMVLRSIGIVAAILVTVLLAWYVIVPQDKAEHFITWESRAVIIPLVLGAGVPLFSLVTWLSYPARIPIVTILILSV